MCIFSANQFLPPLPKGFNVHWAIPFKTTETIDPMLFIAYSSKIQPTSLQKVVAMVSYIHSHIDITMDQFNLVSYEKTIDLIFGARFWGFFLLHVFSCTLIQV